MSRICLTTHASRASKARRMHTEVPITTTPRLVAEPFLVPAAQQDTQVAEIGQVYLNIP